MEEKKGGACSNLVSLVARESFFSVFSQVLRVLRGGTCKLLPGVRGVFRSPPPERACYTTPMQRAPRGRRVHRGRLIELLLAARRLPNGRVVELEIVRHPGAVLIVPFSGRDRLVLIRQYRPVIGEYLWELPAGTLKRGERPLRCAKRELEEEIGCVAADWKRLGVIYPGPGYTTEKIHLFAARGLSRTECRREEDEVITTRTFTRGAVVRLLRSGRIVDAKTIAALVRAGVV